MESGEERGREGGEEVGEVQIFLLLLNLLSEKIGTFDKSEKFKYFLLLWPLFKEFLLLQSGSFVEEI